MRYFAILLLSVFIVPQSAFALVNINTAAHAELTTLTGIGDVKATAIIDYRNTHGPFTAIEDITNVSGIGTVTFNNIKNDITVGDGSEAAQEATPTEDTHETQEQNGTESPPSGGGFVEDTGTIDIDAGGDRTVFVSADSIFEASVSGLIGEPLDSARVVWTFGNGDRKEGQKVLYNFAYPGTYVVVADASSGKYAASERFVVTAIPAQVRLTNVTNEYIAIKNDGDIDLDIGGWMLISGGRHFIFPQRTYILPREEVFVSNARTGLTPQHLTDATLMYPNGTLAASYEAPLFFGRRSGEGSRSGSRQAVTNTGTEPVYSPEAQTQTLEQQDLITAPILAVDGQGEESRAFPPIVGWILTLLAIVGITIIGVLFVRGGEYREYAIEELDE